ncbi:YwmB family TATA-box binding protein [Oceanobacillus sp. CAU 1775]
MKNFLLLILIVISVFLTGAAQLTEADPLLTFINIAEENKYPLKNWEVVRKESFSKKDPERFVNKFRMNEDMTMIKNENSLNYLFEDMSISNDLFTVQYKIIISEKSLKNVEVTTVIIGTEWNDSIEEKYIQISEKLDKTLFSQDGKTFACISLEIDDTIEDRVIINSYASVLELKNKKIQEDKIQNSRVNTIIYGYTSLWDNFFIVKGTSLNIQIAITTLENEKISYKIGTPLLINEY